VTATIEPRGFKEAIAKLQTLQDLKQLAPAVKAGGIHAMRYLKKYPDTSHLKHHKGPYPARWYERKRGGAWALKGGNFHHDKSSERLQQKWGIKTELGGLQVRLSNNASYARLVQDETEQADVHRRGNWWTVQAVAEKQGPVILMQILARVNKILASK